MDFVSDDGELDEGGSQAQPASDCRFDDIDELGGTGGEDGEEESGELVDYSKDDEPGGGSKKHTAKQCQEPPPLSRSRFWERVGMRSLFTVGLLAEAGLALLIQNYHPAQSSTGTQWPYDSLGHNDPAETPRDLPNPLSEGSSGLAWNSVDQFDLHSKLVSIHFFLTYHLPTVLLYDALGCPLPFLRQLLTCCPRHRLITERLGSGAGTRRVR